MLDINIIKVNDKNYSIKTKLDFYEKDEVRVTILNIDEVELSSNTSFTKLKNIWSKQDASDQFNFIKFKQIYQILTKKLIAKYRIKKIII
jgi:hypothetical protein